MVHARLRHLLSILLLPFSVTIVIPAWLFWRRGAVLPEDPALAGRVTQIAGGALMMLGLLWFVGSLRRFIEEGEGTLAPWDPPTRLVVTGLYRYVRNPMITGVSLILLGEASLLLSRSHLVWALLFIAINALVITFVEEPGLAARFGDEYREYCRAVPRLIPRCQPWQQPNRSKGPYQ